MLKKLSMYSRNISRQYKSVIIVFLVLLLIPLLLPDISAHAAGAPNRLNYQGRLKIDNNPVNEVIQISFTITNGNNTAAWLWGAGDSTYLETTCTNGLFSYVLEPTGIVGGWGTVEPWLWVSVKKKASGDIINFPGERINSSIYSLYASSAGALSPEALQSIVISTALWRTDGTNIWNINSGKVGIGVSTPSAFLHLSSMSAQAADTMVQIDTATTTTLFKIKANGDINVRGDIALNTGNINGPGIWFYDNTASSWGVHNYFGRFRIVYSTTEFLTVMSDGKVGILTKAPLHPLHVTGPRYSDAVCAFWTGRVGIETDSPGAALDVNSHVSNERMFQVHKGSVFGIVVGSSGSVCIGGDTAIYSTNKLQVGGNAIADGWNINSERKLKKDIQVLTETEASDLLQKIDSMPLFKYRYKKEPSTRKLRIGFMVDSSPKEILSEDEDSISLGDTCGALMAIIKIQNKKIKELENRLEKVEKR